MKIRKSLHVALLALTLLLMAQCRQAEVPANYTQSKALPRVFPDVTEITVPVNIAPITFELMQKADNVVTRYSFGDDDIVRWL